MLTVEDRLSAIESELAVLQQHMLQARNALLQQMRRESNWISKISGSMKDYPEFDEVVRLGHDARRADAIIEKNGL